MFDEDFIHRLFGDRKGTDRFSGGSMDGSEPNGQFPRRDDIGGSFFNIGIMMDPFQMHRVFEQHMNEVFNSLSSGIINGIDDIFNIPELPPNEGSVNPRDFYLKPEYNQPRPHEKQIQGREEQRSWLGMLVPSQGLSSTSVNIRIVTQPDGTVKTEKIVRNSDGTEERTESVVMPQGRDTPEFSGSLTPKYDFLKPGYKNISPYSEKVDEDIDPRIILSGFENIPNFSNMPGGEKPSSGNTGRSITSFTKITGIQANGEVVTEEIVRHSDGTEQKSSNKTIPNTIPSTNIGESGIIKNSVNQVISIFGKIFK